MKNKSMKRIQRAVAGVLTAAFVTAVVPTETFAADRQYVSKLMDALNKGKQRAQTSGPSMGAGGRG